MLATPAASRPRPGSLLRALGAGAVPVVSRLPAYEEIVGDGDAGLVFEPSDVDVLAAQLERAIRDADLRDAAARRRRRRCARS